jgi:hypothetical protein
MATFPTFPTSGKNGKVSITTGDGQALVLSEMTLQPSYTYRGKSLANLIYLLGTGKTLINMRPEKQPTIDIDGIIDGLEITPGAAADDVAVSAGTIEVGGIIAAVSADATVDLTVATATNTTRWNAICVNTSTKALAVNAGTPTSAGGTLLDTYGTSAGQRPLIPGNELLIGWCGVGTAGQTIVSADIDYLNREYGGVDYEVLPNIGGCKLQRAIDKIHVGSIGRKVYFSGSYLDNVLSEIGTAKEWSLSADSTDVSDETFASGYKQSSVSGFSVTFTQLVADKKVINAVFSREGHCAIKVAFPNGFAWQSAATVVPNITVNPTSMNSMSVTASLLDFPAEA